MIQIKVKGNKKYTRFFIDSIKMEINNSHNTIRLLRLKTLPEHKYNKQLNLVNNQPNKIQQKHHYTLQSGQDKLDGWQVRYRQKKRGERWDDRDEYKQLCYHFKDKRSRMSQNLESIDCNVRQKDQSKEIRCSLQQIQAVSSHRQSERKAIINLDKLHSMNSKAKSNLRHHSLIPLAHVQKNCKSNDHLNKKSNNSYLIYTPQKLASLSYKEILEGHCIEQSKAKPIQQIKQHIKESRGPQSRLRTIEQKSLDRFFKENEANAVKLRFERRQNAKKIKPLQTNLSPWRTKHEKFGK